MANSLWNKEQGLFGWKGLGKDNKWHTTVATCLLMLNFFLLVAAFNELFVLDPPVTGSLSTTVGLILSYEFSSDISLRVADVVFATSTSR